MSKEDELAGDVQTIINTQWNKQTGQEVPSTSEVALAGGLLS